MVSYQHSAVPDNHRIPQCSCFQAGSPLYVETTHWHDHLRSYEPSEVPDNTRIPYFSCRDSRLCGGTTYRINLLWSYEQIEEYSEVPDKIRLEFPTSAVATLVSVAEVERRTGSTFSAARQLSHLRYRAQLLSVSQGKSQLIQQGERQHQASTEENQETIRKELAIKHGRMMGWQCCQCQIDTKNCQKGQVAVDENNWPHVLMMYARSIFAKSHALYEFRTPGPGGSTTIS